MSERDGKSNARAASFFRRTWLPPKGGGYRFGGDTDGPAKSETHNPPKGPAAVTPARG